MKTNQKPEDGYYKSSSSKAAGCVEVKFADGQVAVRDSKNRQNQPLVFNSIEWDAFIRGVKNGEFELK